MKERRVSPQTPLFSPSSSRHPFTERNFGGKMVTGFRPSRVASRGNAAGDEFRQPRKPPLDAEGDPKELRAKNYSILPVLRKMASVTLTRQAKGAPRFYLFEELLGAFDHLRREGPAVYYPLLRWFRP